MVTNEGEEGIVAETKPCKGTGRRIRPSLTTTTTTLTTRWSDERMDGNCGEKRNRILEKLEPLVSSSSSPQPRGNAGYGSGGGGG